MAMQMIYRDIVEQVGAHAGGTKRLLRPPLACFVRRQRLLRPTMAALNVSDVDKIDKQRKANPIF